LFLFIGIVGFEKRGPNPPRRIHGESADTGLTAIDFPAAARPRPGRGPTAAGAAAEPGQPTGITGEVIDEIRTEQAQSDFRRESGADRLGGEKEGGAKPQARKTPGIRVFGPRQRPKADFLRPGRILPNWQPQDCACCVPEVGHDLQDSDRTGPPVGPKRTAGRPSGSAAGSAERRPVGELKRPGRPSGGPSRSAGRRRRRRRCRQVPRPRPKRACPRPGSSRPGRPRGTWRELRESQGLRSLWTSLS
jgi:hypothetical protein